MADNHKPKDRSNADGHTKAGRNSRTGGKRKGQNGPQPLFKVSTKVKTPNHQSIPRPKPKTATKPAITQPKNVSVDIENFFDRLTVAVKKVAHKGNWSSGSRELAEQYIVSLVEGDGTIPPGLTPGSITDRVQQRFALTCVLMKMEKESVLPGQSKPWYLSRVESALSFLAEQKTKQLA